MKVLLAGAWRFEFYEQACTEGLQAAGVEVIPFRWGKFLKSPLGRIEEKWLISGPCIRSLNRELLNAVETVSPDVVLLWRPTVIFPETVSKLASLENLKLVCYNNDNSLSQHFVRSRRMFERRMWKWFNASIPEYDLHLAYRSRNLEQLRNEGARQVEMFRSAYMDDLHRPIDVDGKWICDVAFIGHYEPDGRESALKRLIEDGISVRVRGDRSWARSGAEERLGVGKISPVYGEDYVRAICGARIALCFLSKRQEDTYTRRCFEIPACETLLLSERTDELQTLFQEGVEADFFSSEDELLEKVRIYLANESKREIVARNGREKVINAGHGNLARTANLARQLASLANTESK